MDTKNTSDKILQKYIDLLNGNIRIDKDQTTESDPSTVQKKVSFINNQYSFNESQKRSQRTAILVIVSVLIFIQLIFFNMIVAVMLASITMDLSIFKNVGTEIAGLILDFLKFYVSATIVELLGMLLFIIKNVFDWSIKDFFRRNTN